MTRHSQGRIENSWDISPSDWTYQNICDSGSLMISAIYNEVICRKACFLSWYVQQGDSKTMLCLEAQSKYASLWHQWRQACQLMDVVSTDNPLSTSDCDTNHLETKSLIETYSFSAVPYKHVWRLFQQLLNEHARFQQFVITRLIDSKTQPVQLNNFSR